MQRAPSRRWAGIYGAWIALCALLFHLLGGAEDPSRRSGRILSNEAGERAAAMLATDRRYRDYEVVHVAYAKPGERGPEARWVVLLDRRPHGGFDQAVVIEMRASDGNFILRRAPAGAERGD